MATEPAARRDACRSLLGVDLSGSADDPLASGARSLLARRIASLLVGVMTVGIGGLLVAGGIALLLGGALIAAGLVRLAAIAVPRAPPSLVYALNNLSGALAVALGLVEVGSGVGLDVWAALVVGVPPLLMGRREGASRRVVYALCVAIIAAGEICARVLPPRIVLPAATLPSWRFLNFLGAAIVLAALTIVYRKTLDRAEGRVAEERNLADGLLANILPGAIAERLKRDEYPIADTHAAVTVMFADGVNFSEFAAHNRAETVVDLLNRIVGAFDDMTLRHGIEKIKTMGDAYMAAGGLLGQGGAGAAAAVAALAFEMLDFVHALGREEGMPIDLRIGIHTGPLVAGVIGKHKFTYDVWGETVNIAARLESTSKPGRIHISEATARALGPGWRVERRGPVALKGTGTLTTAFLIGPAAAAAAAQ